MCSKARWSLLLTLVPVLTACAGTPGPPGRVRNSAAQDLGCPKAQLLYHRLGNDAYRITGCGREVHYSYVCPHGVCKWLREGPPRPVASPPR